MEQNQPTTPSSGGKKAIIAVVIIIAAALVVWVSMKDGDTQETTTISPTPNGEMKSDENNSGQQSLKALMAKANSQECSFRDASQVNTTSEGIVYISNNRLRGDFTTTANNVTTKSHMIVKENESYVWTDDSATGFKMKFDESSQTKTSSPQQGVDPNKDFEFSCKPWSADSEKFNPPSNITFSDYSNLILNAPPTATPNSTAPSAGQDIQAMQEAACANLPEPQKTQCKAAIQ